MVRAPVADNMASRVGRARHRLLLHIPLVPNPRPIGIGTEGTRTLTAGVKAKNRPIYQPPSSMAGSIEIDNNSGSSRAGARLGHAVDTSALPIDQLLRINATQLAHRGAVE